MSRNRHHRVRDHFGYDLDTAMILDGAVGDIPSGTILHDALIILRSGGNDTGDLDQINWASPDVGTDVFYWDDPSWLDAPNVVDEDLDTYHEIATGDECIRIELQEELVTYELITRLAFPNTYERTYEVYGTNSSDYSNLVLLGDLTFAPVGSDTAENFTFEWVTGTAYQYFLLTGPDESRRVHEIELHATIGAITTSHPLLTNRDLTDQHPAASVSFDDSIAGLDETDVQGAIEKLAAHTASGSGISSIIANTTTGVKFDWEMPFAGSISEVRLFADTTGSIVVDLWKDTYANFPPTVADSICASAKPTLSSALAYQDTTLTGWTTSFNVGDIIRVNVDSVSSINRVTLALRLERSVSSPVSGSIQLGLIDRTAFIREPTFVYNQALTLGLITRTAVIHAPTLTNTQYIVVAQITQTAVAHAPTIT